MTLERSNEYYTSIVKELSKLPHEVEWVEFKKDYDTPESIGEYISAIANSAALCGKVKGYVLWGIDDQNHNIVGTKFSPRGKKIGNEELEN